MDWQALSVSLWLGVGTLVMLLPFGVALGYVLATRHFRGRAVVEALVAVPLVLPPTVLGYYLLSTFGLQSPFGLAFERIFGQALAFSFPGLLVASAIANIPFVVQPIQRGFEAVPVDVREAGACCGLTPWQRFLRIDVPLAWPAIVTRLNSGLRAHAGRIRCGPDGRREHSWRNAHDEHRDLRPDAGLR